MARIFPTDSVLIAKAMRDYLNTWPKKPTTFMLEDLGKNVPSLMIQQLAAAQLVKAYVNGSYIAAWSFAIYVRVSGDDTASRLDAIACLNDLAEWLTELDDDGNFVRMPVIDDTRKPTKIEMTSTPSIAARYDDGIEDYQAVFSLEYKVRRT
ncbi:MAG: hypothetical protein II897_03940 [Clostridia bacterium]|nr:hypothetical protein [Clostridia bacterium]